MKIERLEDSIKSGDIALSAKNLKKWMPKDSESLAVFFEARNRHFVLMEHYCENPDCDCRRVDLSFHEIGGKDESISDIPAFEIGLAFNVWENDMERERPPLEPDLAAEFLHDLSDKWKHYFRKNYDEVKQLNRRIASYRTPANDILEGMLIPFSTFATESGSILDGGKGVSFVFTLDEKEYLVEDLYCSNPACDCRKVRLAFFERDNKESQIEELFDVTLTFNNKIIDLDAHHCEENQAKKLIEAWRRAHPSIMDSLETRYADIKEIGDRILIEEFEPSITGGANFPKKSGRKIGRNEPCPCGSGKKYKKCCLKNQSG